MAAPFKRWAIRHKPTGHYFPEVGPRMGYTGSEPIDMGEGSAFCPRLFAAESAAKRALTWWLKGITSVMRTRSGGDWGGYEYDENWRTDMPVEEPGFPHVERKREDFEIVPLLLVESVENIKVTVSQEPTPPEKWEVGMLVEFRHRSEFAWNKGTRARINRLREDCADRHGSEYQVFYTSPLNPDGTLSKDCTWWTTPADVIYIREDVI